MQLLYMVTCALPELLLLQTAFHNEYLNYLDSCHHCDVLIRSRDKIKHFLTQLYHLPLALRRFRHIFHVSTREQTTRD